MSSDVYIDFGDPEHVRQYAETLRALKPGGGDPMPPWPYDDSCVNRIGHLATLSYLGFNILDAMRTLRIAFPIVTEELALGAERLWAVYVRRLAEDQQLDDDAFTARYRYLKEGFDFEDHDDPEGIRELFRENIGRAWTTGVD